MTTASDRLAVKQFESLAIKDEEKGEVEAIVGTLEVVDRDREVIRRGAIPDGAKVKMSEYGHNSVPGLGSMAPAPPVGKGILRVEQDRIVFSGKFFLSTSSGVQAFLRLKEMGPDEAWSFGYRILGTEVPDSEWREKGARLMLTKLHPYEVSPVLVGAGIGTGTRSVKCDGCGKSHQGECDICRATMTDLAVRELARFERTRARLLFR